MQSEKPKSGDLPVIWTITDEMWQLIESVLLEDSPPRATGRPREDWRRLGAKAHAAITWLNKSLGVPHGKIAKLFRHLFSITINRSTSVRSLARMAAKCQAAYQEIRTSVRRASRCGVERVAVVGCMFTNASCGVGR